MAVTDEDFQALESEVTQLSETQTTHAAALASIEDRASILEQSKAEHAARLNVLEQGKILSLAAVYTSIYLPFYSAADVVELGVATAVHIPTNYGALALRADPAREFDGFEILLELGSAMGTNLTFQESTGNTAIAASAFSTAGTYLVKRINNAWKVAVLGSTFVTA